MDKKIEEIISKQINSQPNDREVETMFKSLIKEKIAEILVKSKPPKD